MEISKQYGDLKRYICEWSTHVLALQNLNVVTETEPLLVIYTHLIQIKTVCVHVCVECVWVCVCVWCTLCLQPFTVHNNSTVLSPPLSQTKIIFGFILLLKFAYTHHVYRLLYIHVGNFSYKSQVYTLNKPQNYKFKCTKPQHYNLLTYRNPSEHHTNLLMLYSTSAIGHLVLQPVIYWRKEKNSMTKWQSILPIIKSVSIE